MADGRLGTAILPEDVWVKVYTVPAQMLATVNVNICNRHAGEAQISIAFSMTDTVTDGDIYEFQTPVGGRQVIERTAITMSTGERVFVKSNVGNGTVRVHGFEDPAPLAE
jgi:hypothetical protein